ncbi:PREDICTED: prolyl 4-hydroxylase subunit alpha-3-like [Branchiostoma belcheri]|uniref:procollagen-proline 4-dioxygenase n=1 Tax=Branchiostoma belcheri TaxID=7741 RepID=A0A6P4YIW3_BRABE|nr:PREDICTED: prolyl 4-hydroxylase subunit alpha-3-like [Branchiostoma belcheri]
MQYYLCCLLVLLALLATCDADFYSATFRLENLAKVEQRMVESSRRYIQQGGEVPSALQSLCDSMSHPGYGAPGRMVHSPVGAYLLLRRFHRDWADIMEELPNHADVFGQAELEHSFPSAADLEGSALALLRLQGVYNLDLRSLTEGEVVMNCERSQTSTDDSERCQPVNLSRLTGQLTSLPLGVSDVFYIGNVAHKRGEFYYSAIWFNLTLTLVTQRTPSEGDPELLQVLEALGDSYSEVRTPCSSEEDLKQFVLVRNVVTGWLPDEEDPVVAKLSRRVAHITGLNTTFPTGDNFQVLNYGLGGQYEPHYDHLDDEVSRTLVQANRILTFLFYLSEVDAGGATVFTVANIAVPVVKNSAVMFENTNKALVRSGGSVHAGCPVLIGSKWVTNKWIHEVGNELQRPCGLTPEE